MLEVALPTCVPSLNTGTATREAIGEILLLVAGQDDDGEIHFRPDTVCHGGSNGEPMCALFRTGDHLEAPLQTMGFAPLPGIGKPGDTLQ